MKSRLIDMPAFKLVEMIKNKEVTSVEVAAAFIQRILQVNPMLNAIHDFDIGKVLAQARKADEMVRQGKKLGRLHGLPITLKDAFYAPGFKGSKGSVGFFKLSPTDKCATVVKRMLDEGAIILGITNAPEFAAAFETDNLLYGRTNNPHDLRRTPGGSSGGEAALIAAGGSPLGIGSDAGGSIRQPAHYCGIAGFKPTKGAVPTTGNIPNDSPGLHGQLLCYGPMARYVEDLALAFSIIQGPDGIDPYSPPVKITDTETVDVKKLKVAFFSDNGIVTPTDETIAVIRNVAAQLANTVAVVEEAKPDVLHDSYRLVWETVFFGGDKGAFLENMFKAIGQTEFSPLYQSFLKGVKACDFPLHEMRQRLVDMDKFRLEMLKFMQNYDVLLCPVAATPARLHGTTHDNIQEFSYTMAFNLTGWPVVTIRCGTSSEGLPIGIQIAAKPWCDNLALAMAKEIQKKVGVWPISDVSPAPAPEMTSAPPMRARL